MQVRSFRPVVVCAVALLLAFAVSNDWRPSFALTNGGNITALDAPLTESFDTLAQTGTNIAWADNTTIPGWYSTRATYNSGTGSSNTGALYSFGIAGTNPVTDRALGSVGSGGTGTVFWAAKFTNSTGATITSLDVSFVGEQWRTGGSSTATPSVAQTVEFQYQVANAAVISGANAPTTGWVDHDPLDFTSPVFGTTAAAALDGNAAANRAAKSATLSVSIAPGQEVWLRWRDVDHANNDHGLAIDELSVTAHGGVTDSAPSVTSSTPANGASNVAAGSSIVIDFSESVNATGSAFSIVCSSTPQPFTQSASSNVTSITLDPVADLPSGASCSVTVSASQVTDTDANDPPDEMAANHVFSFTTEGAPVVTGTTPADGAINVGLSSTVVVTFSESVSATASAFALECAGVPQPFSQSASPASAFTLTPASPLPAATSCSVTVSASQITDTDAVDPPDTMASNFTASFTTANAPPPGVGNVVINEVDADTPGTDAAEFVELYDGGAGNTALDGLVVVFYNGSSDTVYAAFDLDGYSTGGNGYFTLGNPGVAGVDLIFDPGASGLLQNGADAVALYAGNASDFPVGASVTTAGLQDAIVYDTDDADDAGLLVLLNPDQPQVNENGGGSGQTHSSQRCPNGSGGALNTSTYQQGTPTPDAANSCAAPPAPNNSDVVISQIYGAGGNASATYQNDYVELYNKGAATVDLTGWSLQYASASGSSWDFTRQPLGGPIGPGEYLLVALAGGATGDPLPPANIVGQINLSATNGKVALVDTFEPLVGNCPTSNPHLMDLVGYGSADCREGSATAPSPGNNTTALFRLGGGSVDTNQNGNDFVKGAPNPRRTAPIVELGPQVLGTDPRSSGFNAPRDATILVTFTEPVDVVDPWFTLSCASSGTHGSATFAVNAGGREHYITPNDNFTAGEQCTVTILKDQIHDADTDDTSPNTDTLPVNYVWSFTVSNGTAPPFSSSVHLTMGNPSGAGVSDPNDYLMEKPEYTLAYNRDLGRPNWVSWHLSTEWIGTLTRVDTFRPDPAVPPDWYRVQSFDFSGSGFDRGHLVPNADRDKETSIPINQATFLMSNMLAQAPDNNRGPWASLENYLRTVVDDGNELYVVAGPLGSGGTGSNGGTTTTIAGGHVAVPAFTWKVVLVIPAAAGDDISRVTCATRTIAIMMPNTQGIFDTPWESFLTTVDNVEALTGLNLFSNLPVPVQTCVEAGLNGNNPKNDQSIDFAAIGPHAFGDADFSVSATASSGLPVSFSVLSGPATISGGTVHLTGVGTVTIRASQGGDVNYNAAPDVDRAFDVAKATPAFSGLSSPSIEAGTGAVVVSGTIAANGLVPAGSVSITLGAATVTAPIGPAGAFSASFATAALGPAGSPYSIAFSYAGDATFNSATGSSALTVADTIPPTIALVGPATLAVERGTAFTDPGATATDSFAGNLTSVIQATGTVNTAVLGSYTRTYTVSDGYNTASITRTVNVVDTTGPAISNLVAIPGTLFFPTNTLWPVFIAYNATDASGQATCSLAVSSNNPQSNQGHGIGAIDWLVVSPHLVLLRAERAPQAQPALLYTITVTCSDAGANSSSAQVIVPVRRR